LPGVLAIAPGKSPRWIPTPRVPKMWCNYKIARKSGRVAPGDCSPGAPTDPDMPN
jgi:hypothetical protein